jgi:hypothetical protein
MAFYQRLVFTGCYTVSDFQKFWTFPLITGGSGTPVVNWSIWICMDESRSTSCPLDRTHDILGFDCYCQRKPI